MNAKQKAVYGDRARIIKALAHPARLMMVDELGDGAKCVCEIQSVVGSDMSTVSKHLAVLKNAGIVEDEKRGLQVYYSLRCPCVVEFFDCAEKVLETSAKAQAGALSRRGCGKGRCGR